MFCLSKLLLFLDVAVPPLTTLIQEEVVNEGYNEHFRSLADLLTSSSTLQHVTKNDHHNILQTPQKKNTTQIEAVPPSPNLTWLNGEVYITTKLN